MVMFMKKISINGNIRKAVLKMVPSSQSFDDLQKNFPDSAAKILVRSFEGGLTNQEDENEFRNFIDQHFKREESSNINFSFKDILTEINKDTSIRRLVEMDFKRIADFLCLEPISNALISRLKMNYNTTTKKQKNLLRILSFWIGLKEKKYFDTELNYEILLRLPKKSQQKQKRMEKEGVRVSFYLEEQGDIITSSDIRWLKNEIRECLTDLSLTQHIAHKDIISHSLRTDILLPKRDGRSGEARLYDLAIRWALVLAHQMSVRWLLSDHSTPYKILVIAIVASKFTDTESVSKSLLSVKIAEDNLFIRLNHFARLCSRLTDIKISSESKEIITSDGKYLSVHWITSFWSFFYFDFVKPLLHNDYLPDNMESYQIFQKQLLYTFSHYDINENKDTFKAITAISKFPNNTLLLIEIAKVCFFRKMLKESLIILNILIASEPFNFIGRIFRLLIQKTLAKTQSDFSIALHLYRFAEEEGIFITEEYPYDEDVWCQLGLIYQDIALDILILLKNNKPIFREDGRELSIADISDYLMKAEKCFMKGMAISILGDKTVFLLIINITLKNLLQHIDNISFLSDIESIYKQISSVNIESLINDNREIIDKMVNINKIIRIQILNLFKAKMIDPDSILNTMFATNLLFRNYLPTAYFNMAHIIWDLSFSLDIKLAKRALDLIDKASSMASELDKPNLAVYSVIRATLQSADEFIKIVNNTKRILLKLIEDDLDKGDDYIISEEKRALFNLYFFNIEQEMDDDVLFSSSERIEPVAGESAKIEIHPGQKER